MSGIYGIYRYDGAPVDPGWLQRMREAMAFYGPQGGGNRIEGALGMGHLLLQINPEDAFEDQPMRGHCGWVVCAARLDNRAALLESLHGSTHDIGQISDGQLVSQAFDRWGMDLSPHLQGDWSLAAWDRSQRKLLLALNAFGNAAL